MTNLKDFLLSDASGYEFFTINAFKSYVNRGYYNDYDGNLYRVSQSKILHNESYTLISDLDKYPDTTHVLWISK